MAAQTHLKLGEVSAESGTEKLLAFLICPLPILLWVTQELINTGRGSKAKHALHQKLSFFFFFFFYITLLRHTVSDCCLSLQEITLRRWRISRSV